VTTTPKRRLGGNPNGGPGRKRLKQQPTTPEAIEEARWVLTDDTVEFWERQLTELSVAQKEALDRGNYRDMASVAMRLEKAREQLDVARATAEDVRGMTPEQLLHLAQDLISKLPAPMLAIVAKQIAKRKKGGDDADVR
jgi:hypothetical protein